jgi:hypothetical protein
MEREPEAAQAARRSAEGGRARRAIAGDRPGRRPAAADRRKAPGVIARWNEHGAAMSREAYEASTFA